MPRYSNPILLGFWRPVGIADLFRFGSQRRVGAEILLILQDTQDSALLPYTAKLLGFGGPAPILLPRGGCGAILLVKLLLNLGNSRLWTDIFSSVPNGLPAGKSMARPLQGFLRASFRRLPA